LAVPAEEKKEDKDLDTAAAGKCLHMISKVWLKKIEKVY